VQTTVSVPHFKFGPAYMDEK